IFQKYLKPIVYKPRSMAYYMKIFHKRQEELGWKCLNLEYRRRHKIRKILRNSLKNFTTPCFTKCIDKVDKKITIPFLYESLLTPIEYDIYIQYYVYRNINK